MMSFIIHFNTVIILFVDDSGLYKAAATCCLKTFVKINSGFQWLLSVTRDFMGDDVALSYPTLLLYFFSGK